jgi:prepilin-type processing-associated H-X9-DG protein
MTDAEPRPFQFTLRTLLLVFVVVWASLAVFGVGGVVAAPILLLIVAWARNASSISHALGRVMICALVGLFLSFVFLPASPPRAARRSMCSGNLKLIGLAVLNYGEANGRFPVSHLPDANGKPMHSWRTLVLPYMEQDALFRQYNLKENWDGPKNRKLETTIPYYRCPEAGRIVHPTTNYLAIIGPDSPWGKPLESLRKDEHGRTLYPAMVVEVADSDIQWMEPRDLTFEEACRGINPESGIGISSRHIRSGEFFFCDDMGAHVLFADGSVRWIPASVPPDVLKRVLSGELSVDDDLNQYTRRRVNWTNCAALVVLVASLAVMLFRPRDVQPVAENPSPQPSPGVRGGS